MAQTIKLKRSGTQNAVPTTSQLALGEVALNTYDGKMYIKKSVGGTESIVEIGGDATSSSGLDFTGNLNLEDNVRIVIGDGNDLQIFHDGSHSYIKELGTGNLRIDANDFFVRNAAATQIKIGAEDGGAVKLYYAGVKKFETTSTGITVTGDISLSGNIVDSDENEIISIAQNDIIFNGKHVQSAYGVWLRGENTSSNNRKAGIDSDSQALSLKFYTDSTEHIRIDSSGRLLVNTTSSVDNFAKIQVVGDSSSLARITLKDVDGTNQYTYFEQSGGGTRINTQNGTSNGIFTIGAWDGTTSSDFVRVTSTGRVGIGTTSPGEKLHVSGGNIKVATTDIPAKILLDDSRATAASEISQRSDGRLSLAAVAGSYGTTGIEILSNGNVGIRTTTPYAGAKMQICADDTSPSLNTTAIDDCTLILSNSDDDYGTVFATDGTGKGYIQQRRMAVATYYDLSIQPYGGNVGIGTTSPSTKLDVVGSGRFKLAGSDSSAHRVLVESAGDADYGVYIWSAFSATMGRIGALSTSDGGTDAASINFENYGQDLAFRTGRDASNAERARIDSTGNFLVGKTSSAFNTAGVEIATSGRTRFTRDSANVVEINRTTNTGSLVTFSKDGTTAGGIALATNTSTDISIGSGDVNLLFFTNGNAIVPRKAGDGTSNNFADLGNSSNKFKSLYLGGDITSARLTTSSTKIDITVPIYGSDGKPLAQFFSSTSSGYFGSNTRNNLTLASINIPQWRENNGTFNDILISNKSQNATLGTISSGNITTTGYLRGPSTFTIDPATHGDDTGTVVIAGNLQVDGTTTTINSTTLTVDDKNITLASGSSNAAAANGAGITVDCGSDTDATLTYVSATDDWKFDKPTRVSGLSNAGIAFTSTETLVDGSSALPNGRIFYHSSRLIYDSPSSGHRFAVAGNQGTNLALEIYSNRDIGFYNSSGAADLFWDASTSRLGIGTTSPSTQFHVSSTSTSTLTVQNTTNAGNASLHFRDESNVDQYKVLYDLPNNRAEQHFNGNGLRFYSNQISAEVAKIGFGTNYNTSYFAGRVGVGTTSPSVPLHVDGSVRFDISSGENFYLYRSSSSNLDINLGSSNTDFNSAGTINFKPEGTTIQKYQFKSANFIVNGPNVGISTTTPEAKLHTVGHSRLDGAVLQKSGSGITSANISTDNEYISHNGPVLTNGSTANINQYGYFRGYQAVYGTDGTNGFNPYAQGAYSKPVFEFISNNRGSISLPTDAAIRDGYLYQFVLGNNGGGTNSGVELTSSNTTVLWGITSSNHAYFANNVGIGTSSPANKLSVNTSANGDGIDILSNNTKIGTFGRTVNGSTVVASLDGVSGRAINIGGNVNTAVILGAAGGNVGIGTSSPSSKLTVNGSVSSGAITANDGASAAVPLTIGSGTSTNYTLQRWITTAHSGTTAYMIAYGAAHSSEAGNFAMKNLASSGEIFFELAGSVEPLRFASNGAATFNKAFTLPTSDGSGNQVLQTDGSGNVSWATISGVGTATEIADADGDTRIQTEESSDEDKIRFDVAGTQKAVIDSSNFTVTSGGFRVDDPGNNYPFRVTGYGYMTSRGASITQLNATGDHANVPLSVLADVASTRTASYVEIGDIGSAGNRFKIDNTGRVGIGTTAPAKTLDVAANGSNQGIHLNISGVGRLQMYADGDRNYFKGLSGNGHRITTTGGANVEILNNGNVGIGTTSPETDLNLRDRFYSPNETNGRILNWYATTGGTELNNTNHGFVFCDEDTTTSQPGRVGLALANNTTTNNVWSPAITFGGLSTSGNYQSAGAAIAAKLPSAADTNFRSGELHFFVSGTANADRGLVSKMVINSVGNVGIGTSTPDEFSIGNAYKYLAVGGDKAGIINLVDSGTAGSYLQFGTAAGVRRASIHAESSADLAFTLNSSNTGTSLTERFRIKASNGNVGIGTTSPSQKLQVAGTILADTALAASSGTNAIGIGPESSITDTSSTYRIKLLSDNNSAKLTTYAYGSYLTLKAGVDGTNYANNWSKIELRDGGGVGSNNAHMKFYTHGDERMVIDNDGNVGIGTTSPDAKLQVAYNGGHTSGNISLTHSTLDLYNPLEANTDEKGAILTFSDHYQDANGYPRTVRAAIKGGTDTVGNTADGFLAFYTDSGSANSATERMRITKDGNVGIGTNNPIQKLQVAGAIYANGGNIFIDSGNRLIWGNSQQFIEATNSGPMQFGTGNAERMRIETTGEVGIGTTAPQNVLDLGNGTNGRGIAWGGSGGTAHYNTIWSEYSSASIIIGAGLKGATGSSTFLNPFTGTYGYAAIELDSFSDDGIKFYTGSDSSRTKDAAITPTEHMRLTTSGYLLVGKTNTTFSNAGIELRGGNFGARFTRNFAEPIFVNRTGNNGDIIKFYGNTVELGGIGSEGGDSLYIQSSGSTGTGLRFHPSRGAVEPVRAGVTIDNTISLGADTRRFKDLHLSNAANIGHTSIETSSTSTAATTQVAIATFAAATFRGAEFTIQVTNSTDSTYHLTKVLLIHDGTTPGITEYGTVFTGSAAEATFDADISSGNVRLLATPASTDSMTFKVVRHCITV